MGLNYLLDSDVLIHFAGKVYDKRTHHAISEIIDSGLHISVITKIETLSKNESMRVFIDSAIVYPLSEDVIEKTIEIRRKYKIKTPDAIIVATTIINDLTLLTNNSKDFSNIKNFKIINPINITT